MPFHDQDLQREQIYLGGQISNKHKTFQEIARMSPDYAEIYLLLKKFPKWEQETDEEKVLLEIVELFGQVDFVRNCTELTRLSMIMGDSRTRWKVKGALDELRKSGQNPQP